MPAKKPSAAALLVALIPFAGMCLSVGIWDRIEPKILGLPFNLAWLVLWIGLTSLCMAIAYRLEMRRLHKGRPE